MTDGPIAMALVHAASRRIADHGIEGLSLRAVTADVGKSTMSVFQFFGSKDGLVRAVLENALADERAFHDTMATALAGMPIRGATAADLIATYVLRRAEVCGARLWLEALYKSRQFPDTRDLAREWHRLRLDFWSSLLAGTEHAPLAPLLPGYTATEESYANALGPRMPYALLVQETTRHLIGGSAGGGHDGDDGDGEPSVRDMIERTAAFAPPPAQPTTPAMQRLLEAAVATVEREGPSGFNAKRVAAEEDIPSSQIVYHFGDFATFRNRAIWLALMRGVPHYLGGDRSSAPTPAEGSAWNRELERFVAPAHDGHDAGYYVNYARILGQASLSARRDGAIAPLILYLRAIEGRGIHKASAAAWPAPLRLSRDGATGFAIWIKGHAILNEALARDPDDAAARDDIVAAATLLAHRKPGAA